MRMPEFVRISLSPLLRVLIVVSVPVTVIGMELAVDDPDGHQLWGHVMIAPPVAIGCLAVLEVVWQRLPINRVLEGFRRILVVPTAAALVTGITAGIGYLAGGIAARVTDPYHHWFPPDTGNPGMLTFVSGTALGMFAALFAFMVVSAPLLTSCTPTSSSRSTTATSRSSSEAPRAPRCGASASSSHAWCSLQADSSWSGRCWAGWPP